MRRTTVAKRKARRELGLHAEGPDEQLSLRVRPRRKAVHEADVHFVAVPFDFSDGEGLIDVASALAVCGDKSDLRDRCATVRRPLKGKVSRHASGPWPDWSQRLHWIQTFA
jgi:hypothetical protein